jgi:TetR/AcrR family transcriptional regulator
LQAAIEEFASVGFTGARVDRIADASGCSKQLIYYYYKHKAGLWDAVLLAMTENAPTDWLVVDDELSGSIRHQVYVTGSTRVWTNLLAWEGAELAPGSTPALAETRRAVWERRIAQVEHSKAVGNIDPRFDSEMLVLALSMITAAPQTLRQNTKLITGEEPASQEFADRMTTFLDLLFTHLRPASD